MSNWLPIPSWDGLHPIIIHFPIALLLVAPLFIVLGLIRPERFRLFSISALILMLLGTIGAYVAVATGEAAMQLVERTPELGAAIDQHEEMGENTRLIFTILTVVFALLLAAPRVFKARRPRLLLILHLVFLLLYLGSCLVLARTGHLGGRLVHQFGVHALIGEAAPAIPETASKNPAQPAKDQKEDRKADQ